VHVADVDASMCTGSTREALLAKELKQSRWFTRGWTLLELLARSGSQVLRLSLDIHGDSEGLESGDL
jgi:hypothetical protein